MIKPFLHLSLSMLSIRNLIAIFIFIESISLLLYFVSSYLHYNIPTILSSAIVTTLMLIYLQKSKSLKHKIDKFFLFLLSALICWFLAELLYGYYDGILKIDAYPSFADFFYMVGSILFILFLYLLNRSYKIELGLIISALITFSLFIVYFLYVGIFVFEIYAFSDDLSTLILLFGYPVIDAFIILASIAYFLRGKDISLKKEYSFWIFFALFGLLFFIADLMFGFNDLLKIIDTNRFLDIFYDVGYIMLGIAIIIKIKYTTTSAQNY